MVILLEFREQLRQLYQKTELFLRPIFKFMGVMIEFLFINQMIGYNTWLKNTIVVVILSFIATFLPSSILVLLAACVSLIHIYSLSRILAVIVFVIMLIVYFLFLRFSPRHGYIVLLIPFLTIAKIPYVVPIVAGLCCTPVSIIPLSCGVFLYYLFHMIKEMPLTSNTISVEDAIAIYKYIVDSILSNREMFLMIAVFSIVFLVVYIIRKQAFDHAFSIAIIAGSLLIIFLLVIGNLLLDLEIQLLPTIMGSVISCILAFIIQFFLLALDYSGVEHVQFEDDDYYYYVKAVPKMKVSAPEKNIKRINEKRVSNNTQSLDELSDWDGKEQSHIKKTEELDEEILEYYRNHSHK